MTWLAAIGRRLALQAVLGLAAILLALGALGVGLGVLHVVLSDSLGFTASLSLIAGILVLLAVAAGLAAHFIGWGQRHWQVTQARTPEPESTVILADLAQGLRGAIAAAPAAGILGALAAGFIVGGRSGRDLTALLQLVAAVQLKAGQSEKRRG